MTMNTHKHGVTEEDVRLVFQCADIPAQIIKMERIQNGFCNPVYKITTNEKPYILKITNPHWKTIKTINEAIVMKFLSEHTNIPVAHVYCYSNNTELIGYEFILMEFLPGVTFSEIYSDLTLEQKKPYLQQIARHYRTMLEIEITSVNEMQFGCFEKLESVNNRLLATLGPNVDSRRGPYIDLYDYIISNIEFRIQELEHCKYKCYIPQFLSVIEKLREEQKTTTHHERLVLTHTDLAPKNIIVDPTTHTVTGIVDWEWSCMMVTDQDFTTMTQESVWGDDETRQFLRQEIELCLGQVKYTKLLRRVERRKHMMDPVTFSMCLVAYPDWYRGREKEAIEYEKRLERETEEMFARFNV